MKQEKGTIFWNSMFLVLALVIVLSAVIAFSSLASAVIDTVPITTDNGWSTQTDYCNGINATANQDFWIVGMIKPSTANGSTAYLYYPNSTLRDTATFVGNYAEFSNPTKIMTNEAFALFVGQQTGSWTIVYKVFTNPASNQTYFSTKGRVYFGAGCITAGTMYQQTGYTSNVISINATTTDPNAPPNTAPQLNINSPANNTQFNNSQQVIFNFTAIDTENTTLICNLTIDGVLNATNTSVINGTATIFAVDGITYSSHDWTINCTDEDLSNQTDLRLFTMADTIPLNINLNLPGNNSVLYTNNIIFNFTAIENVNLTFPCTVYLDGVLNQTNATTKNNTLTYFLINGIPFGSHNWTINCSDGLQSNASTGFFTSHSSLVPIVILISPPNSFQSPTSDITFNCSASSLYNNLTNISLWTTYSGTWQVTNTNAISGSNATTNFTNNYSPNILFVWSCYACDNYGYCAWDSNRTAQYYISTTSTDLTPIVVTGIIAFAAFLFLVIVGIGFYAKEYGIAALGSIGLIGTGVYVLINGISVLYNNLLTDMIGIVLIGLGGYILIRGAIELMLEYYNY